MAVMRAPMRQRPAVPRSGSGGSRCRSTSLVTGQGGSVEGGLINGLLPSCQADGGKLVDESKQVKDAEKNEQKLSDQGRTATKFQLNPLAADLVINGQVKVDANGKPIADIQVVDPKTGKVVDHIVVAGDPGGILDLAPFLRHVGTGIGVRACKPRTKPKPRPPGGTSSCPKLHRKQLCFVFDGSISAQGIDKSVNSNSYAGAMKAHVMLAHHVPRRSPARRQRADGTR